MEVKMEEIKKFPGIVPPVITVFDSDGEIDEERTKKFIQHLIDEGVHGIFVAGSTGESSLMNMEQRKKIIDVGVEVCKGKVPLFAGTGHNSTKIAIELSKYAQDAGADAVIVSLPHYPKPSQEAIYRHYKTIAKEIDIPLFVYSWPGQYGVDIEPETVARLAREGYIQGIKDSHFDIDHTAEIVRLTEGKITVWQGFETKILPALCLGADGSVCTIGNIIPKECVEIYNLFKEGKIEEAREKQLSIFGLANVLFSSRHDMQPLKEGIKMLGYDVGDALMPTTEVPQEMKEKIRKELKKLGKL
ncbi:MAG TPA: 4-hydroxy-tetrahydrodipicolinate synthase [candidate division WOR-3 bacterium]|uniref:4-hydroxy-tetrahydrodipicolinate synthase n=1 Tax=candidate division WOR-3 bacterium TaxID=2052148 RepID=A0A7V5HN70_UNCW3|nr:4-hydroxy-tetrahydrodipicolinate synthase [candidate division WOR-3 bacterium]